LDTELGVRDICQTNENIDSDSYNVTSDEEYLSLDTNKDNNTSSLLSLAGMVSSHATIERQNTITQMASRSQNYLILNRVTSSSRKEE
jgi:hypothetical protein